MTDAVAWTYEEAGDARRWLAGLFVALLLHGAAAVLLLSWRTEPTIAASESVTFIDLAPLSSPPAAAPQSPAEPEITPPGKPVAVEPPPLAEPPLPPQRILSDTAVALPPPLPKRKPVPAEPERHAAMPHPAPPNQTRAEPATPAPAAPGAPQRPEASGGTQAVSLDPLAQFAALLERHLERHRRYPKTAQQRGQEGTATLRFTMDRGGHVLAAHIERNSGYAALDDEVIAMLHRAEPLPSTPDTLQRGELEIVKPVRFSLQR